ncbi:MAG TPA: hypothetical protein VIV12_09840 [Streptosporangiaceae bacterium]
MAWLGVVWFCVPGVGVVAERLVRLWVVGLGVVWLSAVLWLTVWCGAERFGVLRFGLLWLDLVWLGLVWLCGRARRAVPQQEVEFGLVWLGLVCLGVTRCRVITLCVIGLRAGGLHPGDADG